MSTKIVLAAAVMLSLVTGGAFAESDSDPFPFAAAPQVTNGHAFVADTGSEMYPELTGNTVQPSSLAQLEPSYGRESLVQTAASLPRGFDEGTVLAVRASKGRVIQAGKVRPAG